MIDTPAKQPHKEVVFVSIALNSKLDLIIAVSLFFLGTLSRLPFMGKVLYHWDSINFAYALKHFDVAAGQPHVPGYILYVFLLRLIDAVVNNAQVSMVGVSIVSSGLAVAFLYILGTAMFNRPVGFAAALFLFSSPLFWFYGEIALPHSLDAFIVIVAVWLLYRIRQGQVPLAIPAAIWLGAAGGFRPQTEVFLAPLALYAAWKLGWRRGLVALAVLAFVNLLWFIPLVWLSGGLFGYLETTQQFYLAFNTTTSIVSGGGLWGIARNVRKLTMYTLYGWGFALIPVILSVIWVRRSLLPQKLRLLNNDKFWFLILWITPALAFYILIHMGQQGLVFVFLPALLLVSALGLYVLTMRWRPLYGQLAITSLVLGNCLLFLFAPTYPLGAERFKLLTVDTLRRHDASYLSRLEGVAQEFSKENTLLLSTEWRFPQYYLPDYALVHYDIGARWEVNEGLPLRQEESRVDEVGIGLRPDSNGFFYVVLFDNDLRALNQSSEREEVLLLPDGQMLTYMRYTPEERLYLGPDGFRIVSDIAGS